jgi:uncharacterized protein with LGFP repeats
VRGDIAREYERLGWERSPLGLPVTDELPLAGRPGAHNHFENGSIYWSPPTGAHELRGAIRARWASLSSETGLLGLPRSGERPDLYGRGRFSVFEHGEVHWCRATGAFEVRGAILQRWKEYGGAPSTLGYPVTGEYDVPGGRRSDFQAGSITWTPAGGPVVRVADWVRDEPLEPGAWRGRCPA